MPPPPSQTNGHKLNGGEEGGIYEGGEGRFLAKAVAASYTSYRVFKLAVLLEANKKV